MLLGAVLAWPLWRTEAAWPAGVAVSDRHGAQHSLLYPPHPEEGHCCAWQAVCCWISPLRAKRVAKRLPPQLHIVNRAHGDDGVMVISVHDARSSRSRATAVGGPQPVEGLAVYHLRTSNAGIATRRASPSLHHIKEPRLPHPITLRQALTTRGHKATRVNRSRCVCLTTQALSPHTHTRTATLTHRHPHTHSAPLSRALPWATCATPRSSALRWPCARRRGSCSAQQPQWRKRRGGSIPCFPCRSDSSLPHHPPGKAPGGGGRREGGSKACEWTVAATPVCAEWGGRASGGRAWPWETVRAGACVLRPAFCVLPLCPPPPTRFERPPLARPPAPLRPWRRAQRAGFGGAFSPHAPPPAPHAPTRPRHHPPRATRSEEVVDRRAECKGQDGEQEAAAALDHPAGAGLLLVDNLAYSPCEEVRGCTVVVLARRRGGCCACMHAGMYRGDTPRPVNSPPLCYPPPICCRRGSGRRTMKP